jgi:polar amino acid transport system substrate-binding protein
MRICGLGSRQFIAAMAMFAPLLAPNVAQAQQSLTMGYFDIPPHVVTVEDGTPKGAAVSYFEEYIAPHLGLAVVWDSVFTPPSRLMDQLRNGDKDAMIFLGKTKERTAYLHYPDPYLVVPETLAFKVDHPIDRVSEVSDLHGLSIGFLVAGRIPEALQDDGITFDLIAGKRLFERNVEKLLLDRIDAIYAPLSTALVNIIDEMGVSDQIKLVPIEFLEPVEIYTVFSKETVSEDTVEKYNRALAKAAEEEAYTDYIETYRSRSSAD